MIDDFKLTNSQLQDLKDLKEALSKLPDGPWSLSTSNSVRRISNELGDGYVLHGWRQPSGGFCDLSMTEEKMRALCTVINTLRESAIGEEQTEENAIGGESQKKDCRTFDKHGIPVRIGDILKTFHFVDENGEKQFVYNQITRGQWLGGFGSCPKKLFFFVSYLNLKKENTSSEGGYWLGTDEGQLDDYEIVQSVECNHKSRKILAWL